MKRRNFLNGLTLGVAVLGAAGSACFPIRATAGEGLKIKDGKLKVSDLVRAYCLIWYYKTARGLVFGQMTSLIGLLGKTITGWTKLAADIRALNTIALVPITLSGNWPKSIKNQVKAANRSASKVNRAIKKAAGFSKDLDRRSRKVKTLQASWKEKTREFKSEEKRARKAAAGKQLTAEETQKLNEKKTRAKKELAKMKSKLDAARAGVEKVNRDLKNVTATIADCRVQLKKDAKERLELNLAFNMDSDWSYADEVTPQFFVRMEGLEERIIGVPIVEQKVTERLFSTKPVLRSVSQQSSSFAIDTDNAAGALTINFHF
ncbi:MAG: hypothetical protein GY952_04500 [Rhodobacteraceae bacterium]|nr:hypothetical protein [Paracoccaceae bacterium]